MNLQAAEKKAPRLRAIAASATGAAAFLAGTAFPAGAHHDDPDDYPGTDPFDSFSDSTIDTQYEATAVIQGALQIGRSPQIHDVSINSPGWRDVKVRNVNISAAGTWSCTVDETAPATGCTKGLITFDDSSSTNAGRWKNLGCHEYGHAAGLQEWPTSTTSCMLNPIDPSVTTLLDEPFPTHDDSEAIHDAAGA